MSYLDYTTYRQLVHQSERIGSEVEMLCKTFLSLKTVCAKHSRTSTSGRIHTRYSDNGE